MTRLDMGSWMSRGIGAFAVLFGLATIGSGGVALFGSDDARAAAGNVVPFVLWFNFPAGFAYLAAGVLLIRRSRWAVGLSALIAFATVLVFAGLGVHIWRGGAYEMRTVGAMALRTVVWLTITILTIRAVR